MALIPLSINTNFAGAPSDGQTLRYAGSQLLLSNELKNDGTSIYLALKTRVGSLVLPSALLHLAPGGSAAGSGQLKFQNGALLLTPESGSMEWDGSFFYMTEGSERSKLVRLRSDLTGAAQSGAIHITGDYSSQGKIGLGSASGYVPSDRIDVTGTGAQRISVSSDVSTGITELRLTINPLSTKRLQILHYGGVSGTFGGFNVSGNAVINFLANAKKILIGSSLDSDLHFVTNDSLRGTISALGEWTIGNIGGKLCFFGTAPVTRQPGVGAVAAGAIYDATARDMLNALYTANRNYGLLT